MKKLFVFLLAFFGCGISNSSSATTKESLVTKTQKADEQTAEILPDLDLSPSTPLVLKNLIPALNRAEAELAALEIKLKLIASEDTIMKLQLQKMKDQAADLKTESTRLESEVKIIKTDSTATQKQALEKRQEIKDLAQQIKIFLSDLRIMQREMKEIEVETAPLK